ncbi:unnamed protein product [Calypogeia fissa]
MRIERPRYSWWGVGPRGVVGGQNDIDHGCPPPAYGRPHFSGQGACGKHAGGDARSDGDRRRVQPVPRCLSTTVLRKPHGPVTSPGGADHGRRWDGDGEESPTADQSCLYQSGCVPIHRLTISTVHPVGVIDFAGKCNAFRGAWPWPCPCPAFSLYRQFCLLAWEFNCKPVEGAPQIVPRGRGLVIEAVFWHRQLHVADSASLSPIPWRAAPLCGVLLERQQVGGTPFAALG